MKKRWTRRQLLEAAWKCQYGDGWPTEQPARDVFALSGQYVDMLDVEDEQDMHAIAAQIACEMAGLA
jgi:hypothetical protein